MFIECVNLFAAAGDLSNSGKSDGHTPYEKHSTGGPPTGLAPTEPGGGGPFPPNDHSLWKTTGQRQYDKNETPQATPWREHTEDPPRKESKCLSIGLSVITACLIVNS